MSDSSNPTEGFLDITRRFAEVAEHYSKLGLFDKWRVAKKFSNVAIEFSRFLDASVADGAKTDAEPEEGKLKS
jgi:hypothetical protein